MWLAVQQCWSQGHWRRGRRFTHTLPLAPVPSVLCTGGSSSTESAILGWCSTGHVCVCAYSVMSTWDPMDCSPPGSSVHGISQARIMEWVAMPLSRVSSWPRGWTWVSCIFCISRRVLYPLTLSALPKETGYINTPYGKWNQSQHHIVFSITCYLTLWHAQVLCWRTL